MPVPAPVTTAIFPPAVICNPSPAQGSRRAHRLLSFETATAPIAMIRKHRKQTEWSDRWDLPPKWARLESAALASPLFRKPAGFYRAAGPLPQTGDYGFALPRAVQVFWY